MKCPYCDSHSTFKSRRSAKGIWRVLAFAVVLARCHSCFRSFWTRGKALGNNLHLPTQD